MRSPHTFDDPFLESFLEFGIIFFWREVEFNGRDGFGYFRGKCGNFSLLREFWKIIYWGFIGFRGLFCFLGFYGLRG